MQSLRSAQLDHRIRTSARRSLRRRKGRSVSEQDKGTSAGVRKRDRGEIIGQGGMWLAKWSLVLASISLGAWIFGWLIEKLWVIILPVALAIVVADSHVAADPRHDQARYATGRGSRHHPGALDRNPGRCDRRHRSVSGQPGPRAREQDHRGHQPGSGLAPGSAAEPEGRPDRQRRPCRHHQGAGKWNRHRFRRFQRREHSELVVGHARFGPDSRFLLHQGRTEVHPLAPRCRRRPRRSASRRGPHPHVGHARRIHQDTSHW